MPYLFTENKVAVEVEELVPMHYKTLGTLQKEIQRYEQLPYGIKRLQRGGNGRRLLIDFDTLRKEIQQKLGDPRIPEHTLIPHFEWDPKASHFYHNFRRQDGSKLNETEIQRYIVNASVLQALIKLEAQRTQHILMRRGSLVGLINSLGNDVATFQNYLRVTYNTEHTIPTSKRFRETYRKFKIEQYTALIKDIAGAAKQNARKVDETIEMLLNGIYANAKSKPTPTDVHRAYEAFLNGYTEVYNPETGELFEPKGFKRISASTVKNYLGKWENRMVTHKLRSGDRQKYMDNYKIRHQLNAPIYAGSLLSIDDRQAPFLYEKGKRPWFYLGVDVASQYISAVVYGKGKEGLILEFYRQLVRNYHQWGINLPLELECESSLNSSYKDTLLRPGALFQNVRIEANNAAGKWIESGVNKPLRYEFEKELEGFIGRPFARNEANQIGPKSEEVITPWNPLIERLLNAIDQFNHAPHPKQPHLTRVQYFIENQNPNTLPTNWAAILPTIGYKVQTSCNLGFVKLQGLKRALALDGAICTGEALINLMRQLEGNSFDVYWLDDNQGNVLKAFVYVNDKMICELLEMPKYNRATYERTDADNDARSLQSAYVATVEAFSAKQSKRLQPVVVQKLQQQTFDSRFTFSSRKVYEPQEHDAEVFETTPEEAFILPETARKSALQRSFSTQ